MTQVKVIALAADMIKEGKTNEEVRKSLFNTKGVKLAQIRAVMALIS